MQQEHGLQLSRLPNTITDAIQVCQRMDFHYLWVDALCIIQDDEDDKSIQLQQMDQIYSLATLTLINASDADASDGVACLRSRSPEHFTCRIDGVRFVTTEPRLEDVLKRSQWFSRGWTYQEYVKLLRTFMTKAGGFHIVLHNITDCLLKVPPIQAYAHFHICSGLLRLPCAALLRGYGVLQTEKCGKS